MAEANPYAPPEAPGSQALERETPEEERVAFEALLRSLGWIRAWLALYFVLGVLAAVLLVAGVVYLFVYSNSPFGVVEPLFVPVWSGLVAFYVVLALRFRRARDGADRATNERTLAAAADAVEKQRRLWTFLGWSTLVLLAFSFLRLRSAERPRVGSPCPPVSLAQRAKQSAGVGVPGSRFA
jgi:hypothetical protein